MEVGIRELKAHLSEYVARVAGGEVFTVTDRGEPRALLTPIGAGSAGELERGLAEGWVVRRSGRAPAAAAPVEPDPGTPRSEEILAGDRGD
jgi:prevent-host-death family protein